MGAGSAPVGCLHRSGTAPIQRRSIPFGGEDLWLQCAQIVPSGTLQKKEGSQMHKADDSELDPAWLTVPSADSGVWSSTSIGALGGDPLQLLVI